LEDKMAKRGKRPDLQPELEEGINSAMNRTPGEVFEFETSDGTERFEIPPRDKRHEGPPEQPSTRDWTKTDRR
jgi:hypothetical protein